MRRYQKYLLHISLLLIVAFIAFAGYRSAPFATAGQEAPPIDKEALEKQAADIRGRPFGPLNTMEQSVYQAGADAAKNSFLSVAKKDQMVIGYVQNDYTTASFRALPRSGENSATIEALRPVQRGPEQTITDAQVSGVVMLRAGASGVRPVTVEGTTLNEVEPYSVTVPSAVLAEVLMVEPEGFKLNYSYVDEDKKLISKMLKLDVPYGGFIYYPSGAAPQGLLASGSCLDALMRDVNNDGYSELFVLRPCVQSDRSTITIHVDVFDGKKLFDCANGTQQAPAQTLEVARFQPHGANDSYLPMQARFAAEDLDKDASLELPIVYSSTNALWLTMVRCSGGALSQPATNLNGESSTVHKIADSSNKSEITTEGADITIGDFDGDGRSEIVVVRGEYHGKNKPNPDEKNRNNLSFYFYRLNGNTMEFMFNFWDEGSNLYCGMYVPSVIRAEAGDLDGNGRDELVYSHPGWYDGNPGVLWVSLRGWDQKLEGPGSKILNMDTYSAYGGWQLNTTFGFHDLALGNYKCTQKNAKQIGIAQSGWNGVVDYAVIEYVDGAFSTGAGFKSEPSEMIRPVSVTAVDLDHETMILGEPTVVSIYDHIQMLVELQAPPKHFDIIDGKTMDVLSQKGKKVDSNLASVYSTAVHLDNTEQSVSSNTHTETLAWSVGATVDGGGAFPTPPENGYGKLRKWLQSGGACANAGGSFASTEAQTNTEGITYTATTLLTAIATDNDCVIYKPGAMTIYRYPVIYPVAGNSRNETRAVSGDEYGLSADVTVTEKPSDLVLQICVPDKLPDPSIGIGSLIDWYQPVHQNYNIFSYPRDISELPKYPTRRTSASGTILTIGGGEGAPDIGSTVSIVENQTISDISSVSNKIGGQGGIGAKMGGVNKYTGKGALNTMMSFGVDKGVSNTSVSQSNFSKCSQFITNWPPSSYIPNVYTNEELKAMTFTLQTAILIDETGALSQANLIHTLKNKEVTMWNPKTGPYALKADPALNLPMRLNIDSWQYRKDPVSSDWSTEDTRTLRGLSICDQYSDVSEYITYDDSTTRAVAVGEKYKIKVRVYNYSFKDISDVKAELYWTPGYTADELTPERKVGTTGPFALEGWDTGSKLFREIEFTWDTAPDIADVQDNTAGVKTGYLHVKLVTSADSQIHDDNDWGYVACALFDPAKYFSKKSTTLSAKPGERGAGIPFKAELVKGSAKLVTEGDKHFVEAEVAVSGTIALPDAKVLVISKQKDGSERLLRGRSFGALLPGEKRITKIRVPLDRKYAENSTGVYVKVISPFLALPVQGPVTPSSSGGCDAGLGFLALGALLPFALKKKR